jgi:erythromycin esterase
MSPLAASIIAAAHPLVTVDPEAPLTDLAPLRTIAGDASIVGVARGAHGSRELTQLTHRLLRFLVDQLGFRSLAIEASWTTGLEIDAWLQTGRGDLTSRLRDANSWWRTSEFVAVLDWMRTFNQQHPDDPMRLVGLDVAADSMSVLERRMATNLLSWQDHTGHKILYWSGSHSAVGHARTVEWVPNEAGSIGRSAGSYLREQLDTNYVSAGLTFHHGSVDLDGTSVAVPAPPADFADAAVAEPGLDYLLDLRARATDGTRMFDDTKAILRLIGPNYNPTWPARMSGGPLTEFFDIVLHTRAVTPTTAH